MEKKKPLIADSIRKLRIKAGWTQKQLGDMTGLSSKHISQIETGSASIGKRVIEKMMAAFSVDERTLRFGEGQEKEEKLHDPDAELVELLIKRVRSRWNTGDPAVRSRIEEALVRIQGEDLKGP